MLQASRRKICENVAEKMQNKKSISRYFADSNSRAARRFRGFSQRVPYFSRGARSRARPRSVARESARESRRKAPGARDSMCTMPGASSIIRHLPQSLAKCLPIFFTSLANFGSFCAVPAPMHHKIPVWFCEKLFEPEERSVTCPCS